MTELTSSSRRARRPAEPEWTLRARAGVARHRQRCRSATASSSAANGSSRARAHASRQLAPRDEEPLAEVAQAGAEDVADAVAAAREAFAALVGAAGQPSGRSTCSGSRASCRSARASSRCSSRSNGGKPIKESRDVDLPLAAAHFFYHAGWADKLEYAFPNRRPRPLGVAGQIIPWNFPLLMLAWKLAPALAAGNTVVLKPAETTPLTALLFCDVLPPGRAPAGRGQHRHRRRLRPARRSSSADVDKIAFTGSTEVGKAIQRRLAGSGKRLTLELGGKAANIVFDDARARPGGRGDRQRHLLQPGPRLLRRLAPARAGVDRRAAWSRS